MRTTGPTDDIERRFQALNVWKKGGTRAPHKPLLVLLALGHLQRGDTRMLAYAEVDAKLRELLREFGPSRQSLHQEYPFCTRIVASISRFFDISGEEQPDDTI